jgi:hypothetical protein
LLSTPYDLILCNNPLCQTLSNALEKSQKTAENLISLSRLFADDTSFSYSSRDELQIQIVIDHDLKELDELISFFSSEFRMQLYISNSWCIVEYFGRKPD